MITTTATTILQHTNKTNICHQNCHHSELKWFPEVVQNTWAMRYKKIKRFQWLTTDLQVSKLHFIIIECWHENDSKTLPSIYIWSSLISNLDGTSKFSNQNHTRKKLYHLSLKHISASWLSRLCHRSFCCTLYLNTCMLHDHHNHVWSVQVCIAYHHGR